MGLEILGEPGPAPGGLYISVYNNNPTIVPKIDFPSATANAHAPNVTLPPGAYVVGDAGPGIWSGSVTHDVAPHTGNCPNTGLTFTVSINTPNSGGNTWPYQNPYPIQIFGTPGTTQDALGPGGTGLVQSGPNGTMVNFFPAIKTYLTFTIEQATVTATQVNPDQTITTFTGTATTTQQAPHACQGNAPSTGDDVSTNTGQVYLDFAPDLDLGGGPLRLRFERYYDALLNFNGISSALGQGWMHNFEMSMTVSASDATVVRFKGKTVRFHLANGTWQLVTPERYLDQLVQTNSGFQYFSVYDNLIYTFNSSGHLTGIQDRNGNQITVTPGPNGPTQASDGLGRTLTFTYTGIHLTKVTDQSGRFVTFVQTSTGNLSAAIDATGKFTSYTYAASPSGIGSAMLTITPPLGNTIYTQTYDAQGRVIKQTDGLGNATTLSYPAAGGTTTTVTDPLGNTSGYGYSTPTLLSSYTDGRGKSGTIAYDASSRPTVVTDRNGNQRTTTYHALSGFPASITDEDGNTTSLTYTASISNGFTAYDLTGITYADGTSESYTRDANGNLLKVTDAAGNITTFTYNPPGQPLTVVNALNGTATFTYNPDGTLAAIKTPAGDTTTFAYDALKRLNQVKHPDATTINYVYDALDRFTQVTDERSDVTKAAYDDNGQLIGTTDALSNVTTNTFDAAENLTAVKTPAGTTSENYNADELVNTITAPTGETRTFGYDADVRAIMASDAVGPVAAVTYDNEAGLTSFTDGAGRKSTSTPDPLGLLTVIKSPLGEAWQRTFDKRNRLTSSKDPLGQTSTFGYDPRGYLAMANEQGAITASYTRNGLGRLTSVTDPDGNNWTRSYDNLGREISETDPVGNKVTYTYDSRNRVNGESSNVATAQVTYDAAGNLTGLAYSDGTNLAYTYDSDNRLTGGTGAAFSLDALGFIVNSNGRAIGRDASSRVNSIDYGPGKVTYTRNNRGLLSQVTDWLGGSVSFTYNAALQVTAIARSNGVTTTYTYDGDGRLNGITETSGPSTLASVVIQRDALGRVTGETRTQPQAVSLVGGMTAFAYDAASQVTGSTYDALGRVTKDALRTYVFDAASRLTSYTGVDGAASFTYDAFGMRTSRTASGVTQLYTINYATALPTVAVVQSKGASSNTDQRYYVYTPDGTPLYWTDAPTGAHHFFHLDELGNTVLLTGDNGAVTDSYGIPPYGERVTQNGNTANPCTWQCAAGAWQEGSTTLFYLRARYTDSVTARFLSRDPVRGLRPRAIDPYQYALGDPVGFSDPSGFTPLGKINWYGTGSPASYADPISMALVAEEFKASALFVNYGLNVRVGHIPNFFPYGTASQFLEEP